jgi:hypothetical protein
MPFSNEPRPMVYYRADKLHQIQIGQSALCYPVGHPDTAHVTGDGETPARTSPVVAMNHCTGEFWTSNTHYKPLMP